PAFAPESTHELTWTLVVLLFEQVMVVQPLPALATSGVQAEIGKFVTPAAQHVVTVQLLIALATAAMQVAGATEPVVVTIGQTVAVQVLPALAAFGVQENTGVSAELSVPQVVVVQLLPALGSDATHAKTATLGLLLVEQTVAVQLLAAAAT